MSIYRCPVCQQMKDSDYELPINDVCPDCGDDMDKVDPDTMQDFLIWLSNHEEDIAIGINDFDELRDLFYQLYGRNAGDTDDNKPLW